MTHPSETQPVANQTVEAANDIHLGGTIRKLLPAEIHLARAHLLRLDADARQRRFSHNVSDSYIEAYAARLTEIGNLTFAFIIQGEVKALAELKRTPFDWSRTGEAAFSVERDFTNRGLATLLMGRIIQSARNRGIRHLQLFCMADNTKMQAIARHYNADLRFEAGSVIADIVPKRFDCASLVTELIDDRFAIAHSIIDMQKRMARTLKA